MLTTQAEKAMPSLCERLLLTPLIVALTPVKSDKSIFLLSLLDSQEHTYSHFSGGPAPPEASPSTSGIGWKALSHSLIYFL